MSNADAPSGVWTRDLQALAADDYSIVPQVGTGGPITAGHGMILGEVQDCDGARLVHAVASVDAPKTALVYTGDEALPNLALSATDAHGTFAAIDLAPGPVTVVAAGDVGGVVTALGFAKVTVVADEVTLVTLRGARPFDVP